MVDWLNMFDWVLKKGHDSACTLESIVNHVIFTHFVFRITTVDGDIPKHLPVKLSPVVQKIMQQIDRDREPNKQRKPMR